MGNIAAVIANTSHAWRTAQIEGFQRTFAAAAGMVGAQVVELRPHVMHDFAMLTTFRHNYHSQLKLNTIMGYKLNMALAIYCHRDIIWASIDKARICRLSG